MLFLLLSFLLSQMQPNQLALWELRAGNVVAVNSSMPSISILYYSSNLGINPDATCQDLLVQISNGDRSVVPLLSSLLVSEGNLSLAEFYWQTNGEELPATRIQLLELLAWFGRFELYSLVSLSPPVPPDLLDTEYSNESAAICAIGWMSPRADGLFHGEQLVSYEDLQQLFNSFPEIDSSQTVRTLNSLELFIERAFYTGGSY